MRDRKARVTKKKYTGYAVLLDTYHGQSFDPKGWCNITRFRSKRAAMKLAKKLSKLLGSKDNAEPYSNSNIRVEQFEGEVITTHLANKIEYVPFKKEEKFLEGTTDEFQEKIEALQEKQ